MTQALTTPQASNDANFTPAVAPSAELLSPQDENLQSMDAFIALKDDADGSLLVEGHVGVGVPENSPSRIVATFIFTNWDGICKAAQQAYLKSLGTVDITPEIAVPGPSLKLVHPNGGLVQ